MLEKKIPFIDEIHARAHLAAIVESSDDAIVSKNLDGIIHTWNSAAEKLFGYTAEEAIGQNITLIIPSNRLDEEHVIIGKVKSGQRVDHFETMRQRKDGTLFDVSISVSPIKNASGEVVGAAKIARDVTLTKEAERATAYLAAIINSSDDAIISKSLDGVITSWNRSAERVFGYTAAEAIGQHINLLIPADKLDEELIIIGKVKAGVKVDHFETVRRAKDGSLIDVSITVSPILDRKGKVIGASKVARDVTAQRKTEIALIDASRKKDEFLAGVSHELRSPMNAIIGLAYILGRSDNLDARQREYLETLNHSAENLMALINDLLDFSKLEADAYELERIEFNLADVIARTINPLKITAQKKGIMLDVIHADPVREYYWGDPLRIQQMLNNLISNAVKFTEEGSVTLKLKGIERGGHTELTFEVADTGIGIPEEKLQTIFEKFVQADSSITRKYGGSGLGLTITKAFAEKMGGRVDVQSRVGLGTTFTLILTLQHSDRSEKIEGVQSSSEKRQKKNVLVVEDYEPNIVVAMAMLDLLGYTYDVVKSGSQAVRRFRESQYDVVLMDIQMEEMDGLESASHIRAYEKENNLPETPIIAMTAHVHEKDKHKCLEIGMNDFIPKPFSPHVLKEKLAGFIGSKKA